MRDDTSGMCTGGNEFLRWNERCLHAR